MSKLTEKIHEYPNEVSSQKEEVTTPGIEHGWAQTHFVIVLIYLILSSLSAALQSETQKWLNLMNNRILAQPKGRCHDIYLFSSEY